MNKLLTFLICALAATPFSVLGSGNEPSEVAERQIDRAATEDENHSLSLSFESSASFDEPTLDMSTRDATTLFTTSQPPSILNLDALRVTRTPVAQLSQHHSFIMPSPLETRVIYPSFAHPRSSPILKQLRLLDLLMAAHFPLALEPKNLMKGHLSAQKSVCQRFLRIYGPCHLFYRNCAFRSLELEAFIQVLTKYNTDPQSSGVSFNGHVRGQFCSRLVQISKRLASFINGAFMNYSELLNYSEKDEKFFLKALEPFASELRELDEFVDAIDWNLSFFCEVSVMSNKSVEAVRENLIKFLHLAFKSI